jgi:pimeloyl-ACP methyl ester carboxylesterase
LAAASADRRPTFVLVHGSGDTARVWRKVQPLLAHESVAVDMLGRATRPYDITRITVADIARVAALDVRAQSSGPWIVVAHSAGAVVAPRLVAELGDVVHLVLVAGVVAPEGGQAVDVVEPARRAEFEARRGPLLAAHRNHSYVPPTSASDPGPDLPPLPEGLEPLRKPRLAQAIDSMVLMFETISWAGVDAAMPRTWVRCRRDSLQTPDRQARLIAASGAADVLDIDTDHTPARDDPAALAKLLESIAARHDG